MRLRVRKGQLTPLRCWLVSQRRRCASAGARVTDERFQKLHYDPRFVPVPQAATKVKIDQRFAKMFSVIPLSHNAARLKRASSATPGFATSALG